LGSASPAAPITVKWTVRKVATLTNPAGNYSKNASGAWIQLAGTFVEWKFVAEINGKLTDVADYYLPIEKAEFIWSYDPLALVPEHFGSASQLLTSERSTLQFSQMQARDVDNNLYPLTDWKIGSCIDDQAGNLDLHYGWKSDGVAVIDSVGHADDVASASRTVGTPFTLSTQPASAGTITLSHTGNFSLGQPSASYTVQVRNSGTSSSNGTVSVSTTVPLGLTPAAIGGPGWNCSLSSFSCSRSDSLAPGSVYPPITLTFSVPTSSLPQVMSQASLSGALGIAVATDVVNFQTAFTDVQPSDLFLPAIDLLRQSGITTGCQSSPPQYCSNATITEAQMAVFVIRSVMGGDSFAYNQTPHFSDVLANNLYFPWIQKMQDLGVALPCATNQYCPDAAVTRGIMAVLIIRSRFGTSMPANYPTTPYFTDVPANHPYFPWIQKMKQLGITTGCSPTTYCPDDPVTRGQMAVFIMRGEFNQLLPDNSSLVVWTSPSTVSPGQVGTVTIIGQNTHFSGTSQVSGGAGIAVSNVVVLNATTLTAQFTIAAGATLGPRSITVITGNEEATLPNGFRVQ